MLRFHVPTMTCGGCIKAITRAVTALDPKATMDADLSAHDVSIATTLPAEAVAAALAKAGYEPQALPVLATAGA
jgi:copper chaperone